MTAWQEHAAPGHGSPLRGLLETAALVLLAVVALGSGIWHTDFVQTEALRVVVAKEMLETGEYLVPQVHHQPYTRKPPLFAWELVALAKLTGAELSEPLARSVSVFAATLYVVTIYWGAWFLFGRRCAFIAGTMALCNWVVFDYGSRAELDITFTAWVTISQLCLYAAIRQAARSGRDGAGRYAEWLAWSGVYVAAGVATLAKGPHAVIFLGLTIAGWSWLQWDVRWLFRPAHLIPAATVFVLVVGWAVYMAGAVGPTHYGHSALVEIVVRLVPRKTRHFLSWFWNIPVFAAITLPASVPALVLLAWSTRERLDARRRDAVAFVLVWLVTNLLFLTIAPAKASRYMLPVFGPVALLGAAGWRMFVTGTLPDRWDRVIRRFTAVVYGVGLAGAAFGLVMAVQVGTTGRLIVWPVDSDLYPLGIVAGLAAGVISFSGLVALRRGVRTGQWARIAILVILLRPVQVLIYNPLREARYSQRELARMVDDVVPPDQPVFVFGRAPLADLEFYSRRHYAWPDPDNPNRVRDVARNGIAYFVMRERRDWETFKALLRYPILEKTELARTPDTLIVAKVDFRLPPGAAPSPRYESAPASAVKEE
jgi:4-amino-4-deoxy-L-arabinose transferase-like glycosyltransferase